MNSGKRVDLLIRGLFERGHETILDIQVTNLEAPYDKGADQNSILDKLEKGREINMRKIVSIREEGSHHFQLRLMDFWV